MKMNFEMDVYKFSIIAVVLVVFIVGIGIVMGLSSSGNDINAADKNASTKTGKTPDAVQGNDNGKVIAKDPPATTPKEPVDDRINLKYKYDSEKKFSVLDYKDRTFFPLLKSPKDYGSIFVTMEDGNAIDTVEKSLEILRIKKVQLTMFVTGEALLEKPDIWKKAIAAGHEICNHTFSHQDFELMTDEQIVAEIWKWEEAANIVLGEEYVTTMKDKFPYFKFPSNNQEKDEHLLRIISALGYRPVGWTLETLNSVIDKNSNISPELRAKAVYKYLTENAKAGNIISLKFNYEDTTYLDEILFSYMNGGMKLKKISDGFILRRNFTFEGQ